MRYVPCCWISLTTKISSQEIPGMLGYTACGYPTETGVNKEASLVSKCFEKVCKYICQESCVSQNYVDRLCCFLHFLSPKGVRDRASKRLFTNAILQPGPGKFPEPSQKIVSATSNRYLMFWANHLMSEILKQQGGAATEYRKYQGYIQHSCDHLGRFLLHDFPKQMSKKYHMMGLLLGSKNKEYHMHRYFVYVHICMYI